ncbi:unnamed protein product [Amoebophrya sp. A120]|nr:unnamed protein product [Amoebophrya sp. A120]|eukprot:GSA120T00006407001.1
MNVSKGKSEASRPGNKRPVSNALEVPTSVLFRPTRTVGVVTDRIPFSLQKLGNNDFLTVGSHNSYQVYDCDTLRLSYLSPEFNEKVRAVCTIGETTLTAFAEEVVIWKKQVEIGRLQQCPNVRNMLNIGGQYVALWAAADGEITGGVDHASLKIYNLQTNALHGRITLESPMDRVTSVTTVPTYLNKILIGTQEGKLLLYNVKTLKQVFAFQNHHSDKVVPTSSSKKATKKDLSSVDMEPTPTSAGSAGSPSTEVLSSEELMINNDDDKNAPQMNDEDAAANAGSGRKNSASIAAAQRRNHDPITCIAACPSVLDIVAVAFQSGRIAMFHAKKDEVLFSLRQKSKQSSGSAASISTNAIHSLSFRSDPCSGAKFEQLVTGCEAGFVLWDLESKEAMHFEPVEDLVKVEFIRGQPFLLAQSGRNALFQYVFDTPDGLPRPLRHRQGNSGPIRALQYYKDDGHEVFVACENHVAKVSLIQQHQNKQFSTKALQDRLPPIFQLSFSPTRHFDWPAVVTAHRDCRVAYLWSAQLQSLVPKRIERRDSNVAVTALVVSTCGHYVFIGYADGTLHRFALQSQQHRGEFWQNGSRTAAHNGSVTCVAVTRELEVISGSNAATDGKLRIWKPRTQALVSEINLPTAEPSSRPGEDAKRLGASFFAGPLGSLLGVALTDGSVAVVDLLSKRVVRHFQNFTSKVLAMSFRKDARWLAVSCAPSATGDAATLKRRKMAGKNSGSSAFSGRVSCPQNKVLIFDLASARCIDVLYFSSPVLTLEWSWNNAFLLTTHPKTAHVGAVHVWANKYLFELDQAAPLLAKDELETNGGTQMDRKPVKMIAKSTSKTTEERDDDCISAWRSGDLSDEEELNKLSTDNKTGVRADEDDADLERVFSALKREREERARCAVTSATGKKPSAMEEAEQASSSASFTSSSVCPTRSRQEMQLSSVPATHWESILHWEQIKDRNKLQQPEKPKQSAPFFLPTTYEGAETKFMQFANEGGEEDPFETAEREKEKERALAGNAKTEETLPGVEQATTSASKANGNKLSKTDFLADADLSGVKDNSSFFLGGNEQKESLPTSSEKVKEPMSRILQMNQNSKKQSGKQFQEVSELQDQFASTLQKHLRRSEFDEALTFLLSQTQSGVHLALSELGALAGGTNEELKQMLKFFRHQFARNQHADLLQTYLQVFLRKHSADLQDDWEAREMLVELGSMQSQNWGEIQNRFQKCISFLRMLTQTQTQW